MKPLMLVPPAQAEALYDTQGDLRDDSRLEDRMTRQPWRDDDALEETRSYSLAPPTGSGSPKRRMHSA